MKKTLMVLLPALFCAASFLNASQPEVLTWSFAKSGPADPNPSWLASHDMRGGRVADGVWRVTEDQPIGLGQLDLWLNPSAGLPALAVTLGFRELPGTDLAINLHNAAGEIVTADLFGNLAESARLGRTDTFIVPLSRFPDAVRVSIRRIKGPVEMHGVVAFPVLESLDDLTAAQKEEFARLLGERLAPESGGGSLRRAATATTRPAATAAMLDATDYPVRYWSGAMDASAAFPADCGGTCYRFFTNLYLSLFPEVEGADKVSFTSSSSALEQVFNGRGMVAMASIPPTDAECAAFEAKFGHSLTVVPIALDAVEVLVNPANQLSNISFKTLRKVFGRDERGSGYWDSNSGLSGPILVAGGHPTYGTSRFFAERVLNGGVFRPDMATLDVAYADGVEEFVAGNRNAIGFAQHTRRTYPVKALALNENGTSVAVDACTVNDGTYPLTRHLYLVVATDNPASLPEPVRRFADLLLSREGQLAVANAGSFPLSAGAVRASRRLLALP